ncbi:hypothetical protein AX761_06350 [Rhizobium sp. 58]|nr:hypothetical protein AX761_06350 [Rhizobium sp. 58]
MSNQWGRNHQPRTGGSSGFLLPVFLCLIIAGGGVYLWFARQTMQAEIAAVNAENIGLTTTIGTITAEKDKLAKDLKAFRENSGDWAGELEKEFADLKLNEVPKLNRLLDKRDADISALEKQMADLRVNAAKAADESAATISAISSDLETARQAVDAREKQVRDLDAEMQGLAGDLAAAQDTVRKRTAERDSARAALVAQAQEADAKLAAAKAENGNTQDATMQALQSALEAERGKVTDLQTKLAAADKARQDDADAAAGLPNAGSDADRGAAANTEPAQDGRVVKRRPESEVETALRLTPGLGGLDADDIEGLRQKLVSGGCVTDALESVFERVPVIVMRNLMRDLKSDC